MPRFNHYAKLKRILDEEPPGWYITLINEATTATNFKGEKVRFDHYYRLLRADGAHIKYGKFQQLARLAEVLNVPEETLLVVVQ
jgi:hypothetical protein